MLDPTASPESLIRLQYAEEIADLCPESLFDEIALTGSSARGIATADSDIEINFWVDDLPGFESRFEWIQSLNVTDIRAIPEPRSDNSYWVNACYRGIELEAGWQTFADLDTALTTLLEARTTDHKALRLAELILSAKSLRGSGVLENWQLRLEYYPPNLADKLIEDALSGWLSENWLEKHLNQWDFKADIHRIWRIIFALNHRWEINWKYALYGLPDLQIYPKNIPNQLAKSKQSEPEIAIIALLELIDDTLELIKSNNGDSEKLLNTHNQCRLLLSQAKST